jgi:hypothetical protein
LAEKTKMTVESPAYKEKAREKPTDFMRERKMGFKELLYFLLSMINESSQNALERYFLKIGKDELSMTQQSFSEARQKLKWEAIQELFDVITNEIYTGYTERWNDYRVMAIDGSKVALPSDKKLRKYFETAGAGSTSVTAQGSMLYDVYNHTVVDALLEPMSTDERTLAVRHIEKLQNMASFGKELIIFDRGYASIELINTLIKANISFVMRVRRKFNTNIDAAQSDDSIILLGENGEKVTAVRVVKFALSDGEIETLITNLWDQELDGEAFKALYFKRWPIETKYDELKNKLEIENFSGRTIKAIKQDFYATMYLSNMASAFYWEAQEKVVEERKDKDNKYEYHVNVNHEIGVLKDKLIVAIIEPDDLKRNKLIDKILEKLSNRVTPFRPNRSIPRNKTPRKANPYSTCKCNDSLTVSG